MKTTQAKTTGMISHMDRAILAVSVVILPLLLLLPFTIHAHSSYLSIGSQVMGWHDGQPVTSKQQVGLNWNAPDSAQVVSIVGLIVMAAFSAMILWRGYTQKSLNALRRFVLYNLVVAIVVLLFTIASYALIRTHSQAAELKVSSQTSTYVLRSRSGSCPIIVSLDARGRNSFIITDAGCLHNFVAPQHTIGYGIAPVYAVVIGVVYGIAPVLNWYRFYISPAHIGGQRKEKLFQ